MIETPQILQTEAQPAAVIHLTVARGEMMKVFGPAVGELMTALAAQGVEPIGAVFAHHLKMSPDTFDFELGVKVASPVKASGRVKPGELPAVKVARTIYHGPMMDFRRPGAHSISGCRRMGTSRPVTCGNCIRSVHNRRLSLRAGVRS